MLHSPFVLESIHSKPLRIVSRVVPLVKATAEEHNAANGFPSGLVAHQERSLEVRDTSRTLDYGLTGNIHAITRKTTFQGAPTNGLTATCMWSSDVG